MVRNPAPSDQARTGLDQALEDSFPASDPLATSPKRGGKEDKRAQLVAQSPEAKGGPIDDITDAKTPVNMAKFHRAFERRRR